MNNQPPTNETRAVGRANQVSLRLNSHFRRVIGGRENEFLFAYDAWFWVLASPLPPNPHSKVTSSPSTGNWSRFFFEKKQMPAERWDLPSWVGFVLSPDFLSESLFYCVLTYRRLSSGSLALGVVGGSVVVSCT